MLEEGLLDACWGLLGSLWGASWRHFEALRGRLGARRQQGANVPGFVVRHDHESQDHHEVYFSEPIKPNSDVSKHIGDFYEHFKQHDWERDQVRSNKTISIMKMKT